MSSYQTYLTWLQSEPNVDLIVLAIKEDIAKGLLIQSEIDALRSRVMFIKKNGHAKYVENNPVDVLKEIFPEAIIIEERKAGGCVNRTSG